MFLCYFLLFVYIFVLLVLGDSMPSKIRVLDEHTINKIAAGEVIESPASVVKELVENSLDAGSTDVCVEIKGGGRQLIRVTDNGCGMNRDDAILCLERHATSKIKEVEDIQSIFTMGFRGEAIPSIAAISKFTLLTCPKEGEGTLLMVDGGRILQCGSAVRSPGTTIEIKSLFFNVPVRKKFQKSPAYDANEILKVMTVLALGHPNIKFQLIDQQKAEIQTGAPIQASLQEQLKDRIANVMGSEFVMGCCPLEIAHEDYSLQGYIGLPSYARLNRTGQYLFINHRAVFSPFVSYVVRQAYGTTLPSNKHPIFILHLSLPGEVIDVNVHPQKKEVRIRQEGALREILLKGVQRALQKGESECHSLFAQVAEPVSDNISHATYTMPSVTPTFSLQSKAEKELIKEYVPLNPAYQALPQNKSSPSLITTPPLEKRAFPRVLNTIPSYIILDALSLEGWKVVPQDGLCLVNQKAAHSRVIFENLLQGHTQQIAVQSLLLPYTMHLNPHEAELLRLHLNRFVASGIHIHEMGPNSFMVDALPEIFGNVDIAKLIENLLENMQEFQEDKVVDKEIERRMALSASYAAVNQRTRLQMEEAQSLVNRLFKCQTPFFCPLGKPTLTYIAADELVKKFQKE